MTCFGVLVQALRMRIAVNDYRTPREDEPMKKPAEAVQVLIRGSYLWPSGELGIVSLRMGDSKLELTFDQAKTLANRIIKVMEG